MNTLDAKKWLDYLIEYVSRRVQKAGHPDWARRRADRIDDNLSRHIWDASTRLEEEYIRDPHVANFLNMERNDMYTCLVRTAMGLRRNPSPDGCIGLFVLVGLFSVNLTRDGNRYESYQIVCETADCFPMSMERIFASIIDLPSTPPTGRVETSGIVEAAVVPDLSFYINGFYIFVATIVCFKILFGFGFAGWI
jgi:hypothetical protein